MNTLEILFIICFTANVITWVWFIILGFRANNTWGFSVLFLPLLTPFMFASRFARKARRAIYYYIIALCGLISLILYIHFFTIDFYTQLLNKIKPEKIEISIERYKPEIIIPVEEIISKEDLDPNLKIIVAEPIETKPAPKPNKKKPKKHGYKAVNINTIHLYINRNIMVTTSIKKHKGKLLSVNPSTLMIKKYILGGSISIPIEKNNILKTEIYL